MTTLGAFAPARAVGGLSSGRRGGQRAAARARRGFESPWLTQPQAFAHPAGNQFTAARWPHSLLRRTSLHTLRVSSAFPGATDVSEGLAELPRTDALPCSESAEGTLGPSLYSGHSENLVCSRLGPALAASVGLVLSLALCQPALALKLEEKKEAAEGEPEAKKKSKKKKKKKKAKADAAEGGGGASTQVATTDEASRAPPWTDHSGLKTAEKEVASRQGTEEAAARPAGPAARSDAASATTAEAPRVGLVVRTSAVSQGTETGSGVGQTASDSTATSSGRASDATGQTATEQQLQASSGSNTTAAGPSAPPVPAAMPPAPSPDPAPAAPEQSQPEQLASVGAGVKVPSHKGRKKAKQTGKSKSKTGPETGGGQYMEVSERQEWVQGLPAVRETIPYTLVLDLQAQGNLKHIIKLPGSVLGARPELALAVLGDERVVRVVMPPADRDPQFWRAWGQQRLDSLLMDAFSPPTAPPEMLPWGTWGPSLKFLRDWGVVGRARTKLPAKEGARREPGGVKQKSKGAGVKKEGPAAPGAKKTAAQGAKKEGPKKDGAKEGVKKEGVKEGVKKGTAPAQAKGRAPAKKLSPQEKAQLAAQERIRKLEEAQKRAERERRALKQQMAERVAAEREERRRWEKEKRERRKQEAQQKKSALAQRKSQMAAEGADSERWANFYKGAAQNEGVRFLMGVGFFFVFYYGVILSIKKQRQDYADRVKLQKAAEEERRKLDSWEDEMAELEAREADEEERRRARGGAPASPEDAALEEQRKKEADNESMKAAMRFMRSGAKVKRARRGKRMRRPTYLDLSDEVRFDDVAGLGEIRRELEEIVDFFQSADKYRRRGSKIPTGILLCGEPGCGKTLLAKAVAGEAGVNFFSVSASQFVEIFVGVGASRVRALYNEAQENAPAVVFIDELDAVGRQRGLTEGSGGQERDATLNQLLTCLDGFEGRGDVITIAATNRPDILDTALVRPGRFDRKIFIPKPSLIGRAQILQVHSRNKVMADDVDYEVVAEITDGMSGAELANVVDVAALKVLREGRTEITTDDLLEAAVLEEGGYRKAQPLSAKRQRQLALNEASQAVVAYNYPEFRNIQLITVTPPITEEKGEIRFKMESANFKSHFLSVATLKAYITVQLAPMLADQMWNPPEEWCTIWADHVDHARKMARQLVVNGLSAGSREGGLFEWSISRVQDPGRTDSVDREASAILEECQRKAQELLTKNRGLVDALVERLEDVKTMQKDELASMVSMYGVYDEAPPPLEDVQGEVRRLREAYASSQG